jgi:hypothetical protein
MASEGLAASQRMGPTGGRRLVRLDCRKGRPQSPPKRAIRAVDAAVVPSEHRPRRSAGVAKTAKQSRGGKNV